MTEEGALVSSGNHELLVEGTHFRLCSSKTDCGGLRKTDGTLVLECCVFDECHGEGGDDNKLGTAMGASDSQLVCQSVLFSACWKQASPYCDSTYGFVRGSVDIGDVNVSQCMSQIGGLTGSFNSVEEGASIRFLQSTQGQDHNVLEIWNKDQTISSMNAINNSLDYNFFYASSAEMTVVDGCFFQNNRHNDYGSVEARNCLSDKYAKATIVGSASTVKLVFHACHSSPFTPRDLDTCSPLFPVLLLITPNR